jgi:hypothetical protein
MKRLSQIALLVLISIFTQSCNKDEKNQDQSQNAISPKISAPPPFVFATPLTNAIPESTILFVEWNSSLPQAIRYKSSVYGLGNISVDDLSRALAQASTSPELAQAIEILKSVGIDSNNPEEIYKLFYQGVGFLYPSLNLSAPTDELCKQSLNPAELGLLFESQDPIEPKLQAIREKLKADGKPIKEIKNGFSIESSNSQHSTLYIFSSNNRALITTSGCNAEKILKGEGNGLKLTTTERFQKATKTLAADRFAFGYLDAQSEIIKAGNTQPNPLESVVFSLGMKDTPEMSGRITLVGQDPKTASLFAGLGTKPSSPLLAAIAKDPLFSLGLDGALIQRGVAKQEGENASIPNATPPEVAAMLKSTKYLFVSARIAQNKQSMFPIPELLILLENSAADAAGVTELTTLLSSQLKSSGMFGDASWKDKVIEGTPTKVMNSALGINLVQATVGNITLFTTQEGLAGDAIKGLKNPVVGSNLSPQLNKLINTPQSVFTLSLSMPKVADLLEQVGGLLTMYAPQVPEVQKLTDPTSLAKLREMGEMGFFVKTEENSFVFKIDYIKTAAPSI